MSYVYTFASSLDGLVFYVGQGSGDRIKSHLWDAKRENVSRVAQRIREIWQQGGKIIIRKPYNNIDSNEAYCLETQLIEHYGYEQLVNSPWAKHRHLVPRVTIGRVTYPSDSKKLKKTDEQIARDGAILA